MGLTILAVNIGSSSVELSVVGPGDDVIATEKTSSQEGLDQCLDRVLEGDVTVDGVVHRVVHGGPTLRKPTVVDDDVRSRLGDAVSLAPLHMPPALAALDHLRERLPDVEHVACFDTAFHAQLPAAAQTYAVPAQWRRRWGVRRYGFHGVSYAYALRRTGELLGRDPDGLHVVLTHLGGGASVCAVRDGRSVDTSMGFTPLDGIVMSTRSGAVDPGLVLWLQTEHRLTPDEVSEDLRRRSGLLGLSETSNDTRELVAAAADGDDRAALALEVFSRSVCREIAAASTSLERLDAVVFTGEIGGDQPEVRAAVCRGLGMLGVEADLRGVVDEDAVLTGRHARVPVVAVVPREELQLAREAVAVLTS